MMPKFSIIIPIYNVAPYLRECLDSVLNQTYTNWEAICVDDGSTDGSGEILDEYAEKDRRFKVIHQKNQGVSAARNAALDVASGEWIGFVDGDDFVETTWLLHVAQEVAADYTISLIRTGCARWESEEHRTTRKVSLNGSLWTLVSRSGFPFMLFLKKELLGSLRFINGIRFREDALFQYDLATRHPRLKISAETGYWHRERLDGAMGQVRRRDDTYKLLREYSKIWRKLSLKDRCDNLEASTFWVTKDIREWLVRCPNRTMSDGLKVWVVLWSIVIRGGFNPFVVGTLFDGLRWVGYLLTAFSPILFFTRLSFRMH